MRETPPSGGCGARRVLPDSPGRSKLTPFRALLVGNIQPEKRTTVAGHRAASEPGSRRIQMRVRSRIWGKGLRLAAIIAACTLANNTLNAQAEQFAATHAPAPPANIRNLT